MDERNRVAADDWMRDHLPDSAEYSLEDSEGAGSTESYFFLRLRDSATVVYKVAVFDGKVSSQAVIHNLRRHCPLHGDRTASGSMDGFTVVLKSDPASARASVAPTV